MRSTTTSAPVLSRMRAFRWVVAVFGVCVLGVTLTVREATQSERESRADALRHATDLAAEDITHHHLESIEIGLESLRATIDGTPSDRSDFVRAANVLLRMRGARAFEFAAYERSGNSSEHLRIEWIEPVEGNEAALEFDLWSEPTRRAAAIAARDTGRVQMTAPLQLIQSPDRPGLLMLLPVYDGIPRSLAERRLAFRGTVLVAIDAHLAFADATPPEVDLSVIDVTAAEPVALLGTATEPGRFAQQIERYGRRWAITIEPSTAWVEANTEGTNAALFTALVVAALLIALFGVLATRRHRAEALAARLTADLRQREDHLERVVDDLQSSEVRIREIIDTAGDAILLVDANGRVTLCNVAAETMFGHPRARILGSEVVGLIAPTDRPSIVSAEWLRDPALASTARDGTLYGVRSDGTTFPIWLAVSELTLQGDTAFTWIARDVSMQVEYESHLHELAVHDPLTGLGNRTLLFQQVELAIERARRTTKLVAVLFCDLDHFKVVNDSLGHAIGDELLVEASSRLRSVTRTSDFVARFGGDEFVICAENIASVGGVADFASRILTVFERPFLLEGREIFVTLSLGVAVWDGGRQTPDDLIRCADIAMYRAKGAGRNQFELYDSAMQSWAHARLAYDAALRHAIEDEDFIAAYQPIVDLERGSVAKFEALVRWDRGDLGLVSPSEFIPLAEETGLIVPLGAQMLRMAMRDCVIWQASAPGVGVTINVSARQLDGALLRTVADELRSSRIDPALVTLEITESLLMADAARALELLEGLRSLGVQLALDDFGTGYSSLTYLQEFPMQILKIDQTFVRSIDRSASERIVASVIGLAHGLGLEVVAEGVETAVQREALHAFGCEYGQGFLWSRPLLLDEAIAFLDRSAAETLA